ncbi:MAG TPA: hypothetical protein VJU18_00075 [Vicinamibacteria bacterium]|nr:hypothetical protein [Vicinamibacteria bacterium]
MNRREFLARLVEAGALVAAGPAVAEVLETWVASAPTALLPAHLTRLDIDAALKVIFSESLVRDFVPDSSLMALFDQNRWLSTTPGGRYIEVGHFWALPPDEALR